MGYNARPNDPRAKTSDADFVRYIETIGPTAYAEQFGLDISAVFGRRRTLEKLYGRQITAPKTGNASVTRHDVKHAARLHFDCLNGTVLIGSDAHIRSRHPTTAMRAFIKFADEMKPRVLVLNGDVMDFPQVSRHPSSWEVTPTVAQEIEYANAVLNRIEDAVPSNCKLAWTLGNHDSRLETRIATVAPELAKLKGVHLKDHFSPRWQPCWSVWINSDVAVKHRWKGGIGATRANTLNAGTSMVTGHLHSANVRGLTDYKGTRWGVDTGCLADPDSESFLYAEDAPLDWRSGFAVLTFKDGVLLQPELVLVYDKTHVQFRGQILKV